MPPKEKSTTKKPAAGRGGKRAAGAGAAASRAAAPKENEELEDEELDEGASMELANGSVVHISNIMATARLGCLLDLRAVSRHVKNCEFNCGSRKNSCIMRIRSPPVTAEIFNSGKVHNNAAAMPPQNRAPASAPCAQRQQAEMTSARSSSVRLA
jgi:hypothetical protein